MFQTNLSEVEIKKITIRKLTTEWGTQKFRILNLSYFEYVEKIIFIRKKNFPRHARFKQFLFGKIIQATGKSPFMGFKF